jgi:hypothetical protein
LLLVANDPQISSSKYESTEETAASEAEAVPGEAGGAEGDLLLVVSKK